MKTLRAEQLERKVTAFEAGGEAKRAALDKAMSKLYKWQGLHEQLAGLIEQVNTKIGGDLSGLKLTQNEINALISICYNRPNAIYAIKSELSKDRSEWDYEVFFNAIMDDYPDNPMFRKGWENRIRITLDLFFNK